MYLKHFSHSHGLVFHQVPQGSQIHCSACKSLGSGDVYACWHCNYFLHDQCFRATRSLNHPSHPLHPLTLALSPTYPSGSFVCNSCNHGGDGLSYSCSACEFDIHIHCALIPNPTPRSINSSVPNNPVYPPILDHIPHNASIYPPVPNNPAYPPPNATAPPVQSDETSMAKHLSHPHLLKPNEIEQNKGKDCSACESDLSGSAYTCTKPDCSFDLHEACFDLRRKVRHEFHSHALTLLAAPALDVYTCDACQGAGKGFVYNCATCSYHLHIDCFRYPKTVSRPDHDHPLSLSTPISECFMCDVCEILVNENAWVYYCFQCDFGTHLECVHSEIQLKNVSKEEAEIEQENESEEVEEEEAEIEQEIESEEEEVEIKQENESKEEEEVEIEQESESEEEEAEIEQEDKSEEEEEEEAEIEQEDESEEEVEIEQEEEEEGDLADRLAKSQQKYAHSLIMLRMAQQNAQLVNSMANSWRTFM